MGDHPLRPSWNTMKSELSSEPSGPGKGLNGPGDHGVSDLIAP